MSTYTLQSARTLAQAPIPQADLERKEEMEIAWKAYRGKFADPLKVKDKQPNDNVKTNRCGPIVNKGVSFLFGQTLLLECADQDIVDKLWGDDDDKMTLLAKIAINGGAFGQTFLKLIPATGTMPYPRIVNLDPRLIRIVSDPEDYDLHLAYIIEYPLQDDLQKRQIIARVDPDHDVVSTGDYDLQDTWTITNYTRRMGYGAWEQVGATLVWPYPFAPIFTCQNLPLPNEPWGMSDLTYTLIGMNNSLNFNQSNTARVIKFHAHPKTWGKGFKASQMSTAIDDVLVIESENGTLQSLEMHSDLASSRNFAGDLRSDMDEESRVPAVALGRLESLPRGNISGVALQLLFQPLTEKTVQKQRLYGKLIREVTRAALVLAGKLSTSQYEDYEVLIHWQDLLPNDDLAAAQTAQIYKLLGVSDDTILSRLGFDPKEEAKKSAEEDQVNMEKQLLFLQLGLLPSPVAPGQQPQAGQQPPQGGPQKP